ncbi:universal stress protein [Methylorubrum populi]|uniref:universal stress protein n=1 Tax=Methylorubrum populi TaxID=223967 RepID=UPI0030B88FF7
MAGCAHPTGSAGQATRGAKANRALTLCLDHPVGADQVNVLPVVGDVTETLRTQIGLFRADMLVMGAYRHSRLQEWFLGGVTQSLLSRSPVPLFLAH